MSRKHRVLLLAEACNPEWVSVPLVGWSMVQALAKVTDAHLVTQCRNREALLRAGWREGEDFTALDTENVARWQWRLACLLRGGAGKGWTMVTALSALTNHHFENRVWRHFGSRIQRHEFDIVHRVTPVSPTVPSPIARLCRDADVPFVLGPLNGGVAWPKGFEKTRWQECEWLSYVRDFYKLLPDYRSTRQCASAILVGSRATLEHMPAYARAKCHYVPENAIAPDRFPRGTVRRPRLAKGPLKLIFVGRLVPYKGADMLLEAITPLVQNRQVHLTVVGDGPQRTQLQQVIASRGLDQGVKLLGWVDHKDIRTHLDAADVFAFPSIREFGGGVVLEAMAAGVPPLVVDYGGPGELVTPETGWALPLYSRERLIQDLRATVQYMIDHPGEIESKSAASLERCFRDFTWSAKAERVLGIYRGLAPMEELPTQIAIHAANTRYHDHTGAVA